MRKVGRGTVIIADLDPTVGNEQRGTRPCIAVSDPDVSAGQRFPLIAVVPLTRTPGSGALYPRLEPGENGIAQTSYAMLDHIRSIDKRRIRGIGRPVAASEMEAIDSGLRLFLGLDSEEGEL